MLKQTSTKGISTPIVIGIILIIAVIAGGAFIYSQNNNWRTFESEEYSFRVEYPSEWYLIDKDPVYISPFSRKHIKVSEDHFGFFVMEYPLGEPGWIQDWIYSEISRVKLWGPSPDFDVKMVEDLRDTSSLKFELKNSKEKSGKIYDEVIYWLMGKNLVLRMAYEYPVKEQNNYKPIFEKIFSTFEFIGESKDIVVEFPESEESKEAVFKSQPPSGSLILPAIPTNSQYQLHGSLFKEDFAQYIYYYCPNEEYRWEEGMCMRIIITEDYNVDYETSKNREVEFSANKVERSFDFQGSEGVIIYSYKGDKPDDGWLYLNRSGHLFFISSLSDDFNSDPNNFINLLERLEPAP